MYFNVVVVKTNVFCNYIYLDSLQKCMLLHLNEPEWPLSNQFVLKLRLRMARLEVDIVVTVKTFDVICSAFGDLCRRKLQFQSSFSI